MLAETFSAFITVTYGGTVDLKGTESLMKLAFENGINTFDTAEVYANGQAETVMGQAIKNLNMKREDIVLITKIFFGTGGKTPNSRGLSRKHIIEGALASLKRTGVEYFDVIKAHRPDASVPMEEIVRAFNYLIEKGICFYWGTSEWSGVQLMEAHSICNKLGLIPPASDQPQLNMFHRERVEKEYAPLYAAPYELGLTIWSPLASGLLTGKYNEGQIPKGSRFDNHASFFDSTIKSLQSGEGKAKIEKVKKLTEVAKELGTSMATLAIAWCAANTNVSTVILGATKPEQLEENLKALEVIPKLTPEVMEKIDTILDNKPVPAPTYGR